MTKIPFEEFVNVTIMNTVYDAGTYDVEGTDPETALEAAKVITTAHLEAVIEELEGAIHELNDDPKLTTFALIKTHEALRGRIITLKAQLKGENDDV